MVEIHQDKVVISNPGGLLAGLNVKFLSSLSIRRNELIADMFGRMGKVERMGTGINRMRAATKAAGIAAPKFTSDHFFTTTFKRQGFNFTSGSEISSEKGSEISSEKILRFIKKDKQASAREIAEALGVSSRAVEKQIAKLKKTGYLKRIGSPKSGEWEIID
jgi:ATP-dependent DNA helicase RecG